MYISIICLPIISSADERKKDQAEEQKAALQKDIKVPAKNEICDPDLASAGKPLKSC